MLIQIVNLLVNLIEALLFYYVISHTLEIKFRDVKKFIIIATDFATITFCDFFISNTILAILLILISELLISFLMTKNSITEKIFWGCSCSILSLVSDNIAILSAGLIIGDNLSKVYESTIMRYFAICIYILLMATFAFIVVQIKNKSITFPFYVLILLFLICIIGVFAIQIMLWSMVEVEKSPLLAELKQVSNLLKFSAFAFIVIFALLFILLYIIGNIHKRNLDFQHEKELYELERNQYQTLHKTHQLLRAWKHEFSDHLQTIIQLQNSEDTESSQRYISQLIDGFEQTSTTVDTGIAALDAVIALKKYEADNQNIRFDYELFLPESTLLPLNDVLFSSLLNNLLNNAIEASSKTTEPFILLKIKMINSSLIIEVSNSSTGEYKYNSDNKLATLKKEHGHGIGIERITDIINEAEGIYEITPETDSFSFRIILPLND